MNLAAFISQSVETINQLRVIDCPPQVFLRVIVCRRRRLPYFALFPFCHCQLLRKGQLLAHNTISLSLSFPSCRATITIYLLFRVSLAPPTKWQCHGSVVAFLPCLPAPLTLSISLSLSFYLSSFFLSFWLSLSFFFRQRRGEIDLPFCPFPDQGRAADLNF